MKVKFVYTKLIEVEKEIDDKFSALLDETNSWACYDIREELYEQSEETWAQIQKEDEDFYNRMYILSEDNDYLAEY
jgi:hypothetical protein